MPPLDPASTAALVALLAAQADDKQFILESVATHFRFFQSRFPAAVALAPQTGEQAYLVAYAMLYRRIPFRGGMVVGASSVTMAKGLLAQDAQFQTQSYDQKHPFTEYTPGGNGTFVGP